MRPDIHKPICPLTLRNNLLVAASSQERQASLVDQQFAPFSWTWLKAVGVPILMDGAGGLFFIAPKGP
jgi:hypothetical protein